MVQFFVNFGHLASCIRVNGGNLRQMALNFAKIWLRTHAVFINTRDFAFFIDNATPRLRLELRKFFFTSFIQRSIRIDQSSENDEP